MPSAFSRWFRTTSRGSSRRPQRPSPKRYAFFDELTGKAVESAWDSVEADANDSHRRENSTRVICEYFERDTGHWPANLPNNGAGGRDCYAGGLRGYTSLVVGKNQQLFACTVNEYAGNRTDRKFDTRLRFSQWYGYPTKKDDISVLHDQVPDVYNLLSQHSVSDETVPNKTEVCNSDTKWMWTTMTGSSLWFENHKFYHEFKSSTYEANDNSNILKIEYSSDQVSSFLFQGHCEDWRYVNRRLFLPMWLTCLDKTTPMHVKA